MLILVFMLISTVSGTTVCKILGPCKAMCNGTVVDLSAILGKSLPLQISDLANGNKSEEIFFFLAPCSGYSCGNEGPETAVCQDTASKLISCGLLNNTTWRFETAEPYRYSVIFSGGEGGRTSTIKFIEDFSTRGMNSSYIDEYPTNHYNFRVSGPCIRPGSCHNARNTYKPIGIIGFVFLTILAISVVLYLTIGLVVMYRRGAKRLELIPNFQFWKDLPHLVKDGCLFVTSPCCCWEESAVASYHELPETTPVI